MFTKIDQNSVVSAMIGEHDDEIHVYFSIVANDQ